MDFNQFKKRIGLKIKYYRKNKFKLKKNRKIGQD